jgi:arginine exporter protein ArgO
MLKYLFQGLLFGIAYVAPIGTQNLYVINTATRKSRLKHIRLHLLLGGFRASLPSEMSKYFILGVCIASFVWFNALAAFISKFRSKFNNIIKWINITCGVILILYGLKLGYSFIQLI